MKLCIFDLANSPCVWGDNSSTPTLNYNDSTTKCNLSRNFNLDANNYIVNPSGNQIKYNNGTYTLPIKLVRTREEHLQDNHFINPANILSNFVADSSIHTTSSDLLEIDATEGFQLNNSLLKNNQSKVLFFRLNEEPVSSSYFTIEMFGFSKILSSKKVIQKMYVFDSPFPSTDDRGTELINDVYFYEDINIFISYLTCVNSSTYNLDVFDTDKNFVGIQYLHSAIVPQGRPCDYFRFIGLNKNVDNKYYASTKDGYVFRNFINFIPYTAFQKNTVNVPYGYAALITNVKREFQLSKAGVGMKGYFADGFTSGIDWCVDYYGAPYKIFKYYGTYFDDADFQSGLKRMIPSAILIPVNIGTTGSEIDTTVIRVGRLKEIGF